MTVPRLDRRSIFLHQNALNRAIQKLRQVSRSRLPTVLPGQVQQFARGQQGGQLALALNVVAPEGLAPLLRDVPECCAEQRHGVQAATLAASAGMPCAASRSAVSVSAKAGSLIGIIPVATGLNARTLCPAWRNSRISSAAM